MGINNTNFDCEFEKLMKIILIIKTPTGQNQ